MFLRRISTVPTEYRPCYEIIIIIRHWLADYINILFFTDFSIQHVSQSFVLGKRIFFCGVIRINHNACNIITLFAPYTYNIGTFFNLFIQLEEKKLR